MQTNRYIYIVRDYKETYLYDIAYKPRRGENTIEKSSVANKICK